MNALSRAAATAVATTLGVSLLAPAATAAAPKWRQIAKPPTGTFLAEVLAPARNDAWAFGARGNLDREPAPAAYHWNGRKWSRSVLPAGAHGPVIAAGASSSRDVWALTGGTEGAPVGKRVLRRTAPTGAGFRPASLLHWNGKRWTRSAAPKGVSPTELTVGGPRDVWLLGARYRMQNPTVTMHYDGRSWKEVKAPFLIDTMRASGKTLWAAGRDPRKGTALAARHDGRRWHVEKIDRYLPKPPRSQNVAVEFGGVTPTKDGVVLTGAAFTTGEGFALRRDKRGWRYERVRGTGWLWGPGVADVRGGGMTFTGTDRDGLNAVMAYRSAKGSWTVTKVRNGGRGQAYLSPLVRVPGTHTLWGTVAAIETQGSVKDNAVVSYGPTR